MRDVTFGTLILMLFVTIKTNAQVEDKLTFGSTIGFGHSWNNIDYSSPVKKFNPSFNSSLRLMYRFVPHFSAGVDAAFKTEGYKLENTGFKFIAHLHYIDLDPKAWLFFGKYNKTFQPKIGIGPNFGFLVGGKRKEDILYGQSGESRSKDYYKFFNFGLAGSFGFNYQLKSKAWLNIDATYNHGLSNILKSGVDNIKTRSLFLNVGLTYGGGYAEKNWRD